MKPLLYFSPRQLHEAPLIALEEIGQPFETQPVELAAGEQRKHSFLAINPAGKVPALKTDHGDHAEWRESMDTRQTNLPDNAASATGGSLASD